MDRLLAYTQCFSV